MVRKSLDSERSAEIDVESVRRLETPGFPKAFLAFGASAVVLLGLFSDTTRSLVDQWWSVATYSHGFLIIPVCAYLVWRERARVRNAAPRPALVAGLVAMAAMSIAWLLGDCANVLIVQQAALIGMVQALGLTIFGWPIVRRFAAPLLFLYLAIPFGDFLVAPLQEITADLTTWLLRLSGVPVDRDGLFIHIPTGRFVVAEACAGLRSLLSTVALGVLGSYLFFGSWARRLLFLALSALVPIGANALRAYGIVMLAYISDHTLAVGVDHLIYGWIFLSVVTVSLLGAGVLLRDRVAQDRVPPVVPRSLRRMPAAHSSRLWLSAVASGVLACATVAYSEASARAGMASGHAALASFHPSAPWEPMPMDERDWHPVFVGADARLHAAYRSGNDRVSFFLAYYQRQRQGAEAVSDLNHLTDGAVWVQASRGRDVVIVQGAPLTVQSLDARSGAARRLVWSFYWVDGEFTSHPMVAKWLQVRARVLARPTAAAAIAVAADYEDDPQAAVSALQGFLEHAGSLAGLLKASARSA